MVPSDHRRDRTTYDSTFTATWIAGQKVFSNLRFGNLIIQNGTPDHDWLLHSQRDDDVNRGLVRRVFFLDYRFLRVIMRGSHTLFLLPPMDNQRKLRYGLVDKVRSELIRSSLPWEGRQPTDSTLMAGCTPAKGVQPVPAVLYLGRRKQRLSRDPSSSSDCDLSARTPFSDAILPTRT